MKCTIIGPAYPLRGGISHHVYYLQRELTKRGHSVQVISFRKLYPKFLFPGSTEFDQSSSKLDPKATPILSSLNPLSWARAFTTVKSFSPDIIVLQWWHTFFAPVIGMLARTFKWKGLKCVLECHNVFPHERSPVDTALLNFATRHMVGFITHSQRDRSDLLPFARGKRISVCPLPLPHEFASQTTSSRSGRTILFFGTVRKYKGLETLLAALPKVLGIIECELVIAGEFYEPVERYLDLIRQFGLEKRVTLENRYIANEEVAEIFERADVLVLPYLNATQSAVARMALSNGLPIIASNTGGLSEVVIENVNGLLFPSGDADALARQIVRYFSNGLGAEFARNIKSTATTAPACELVEAIEEFANLPE